MWTLFQNVELTAGNDVTTLLIKFETIKMSMFVIYNVIVFTL